MDREIIQQVMERMQEVWLSGLEENWHNARFLLQWWQALWNLGTMSTIFLGGKLWK